MTSDSGNMVAEANDSLHSATGVLASVQQIENLARTSGDVLMHNASFSRDDLVQTANELAQLADYLAQVSAARSHFLGKVSHELRTPLTIAKGWVSMLRDNDLPPGQGSVPQAYVCVDRGRVAQVLNNLIGNACRYVPHFQTGRIELLVGVTETSVQLSVRDNGIGMSSEDLPRVFEPFYQIEGRQRGKSGLGLTVAQELVRAHGGSLTVESALGKGTTFHIWLRRLDQEQAQEDGDDRS